MLLAGLIAILDGSLATGVVPLSVPSSPAWSHTARLLMGSAIPSYLPCSHGNRGPRSNRSA